MRGFVKNEEDEYDEECEDEEDEEEKKADKEFSDNKQIINYNMDN